MNTFLFSISRSLNNFICYNSGLRVVHAKKDSTAQRNNHWNFLMRTAGAQGNCMGGRVGKCAGANWICREQVECDQNQSVTDNTTAQKHKNRPALLCAQCTIFLGSTAHTCPHTHNYGYTWVYFEYVQTADMSSTEASSMQYQHVPAVPRSICDGQNSIQARNY